MSRRAIISGAGIGGLATALALSQAGFDVTLYEQAGALEEFGAGLQLTPNATRVLSSLGVLESVRAVSTVPDAVCVLRGSDDAMLMRMALDDAERRWGAPYLALHRADLQRALADAAESSERSPAIGIDCRRRGGRRRSRLRRLEARRGDHRGPGGSPGRRGRAPFARPRTPGSGGRRQGGVHRAGRVSRHGRIRAWSTRVGGGRKSCCASVRTRISFITRCAADRSSIWSPSSRRGGGAPTTIILGTERPTGRRSSALSPAGRGRRESFSRRRQTGGRGRFTAVRRSGPLARRHRAGRRCGASDGPVPRPGRGAGDRGRGRARKRPLADKRHSGSAHGLFPVAGRARDPGSGRSAAAGAHLSHERSGGARPRRCDAADGPQRLKARYDWLYGA